MTQSREEPCRVCTSPSRFVFDQTVLEEHQVRYYECEQCGYLQTETPYWLDQAYANAINDSDTGIMMRNRQNLGRVIMTLLSIGQLNGMVIDHAGGYGILVRLLRDAGIDARWSDKYCENLLAKGFEAETKCCDLLTAFEVFEHLVDPVTELRDMLASAPAVLISTELLPDASTPVRDWWYLGTHHGQHVGFFTVATLESMARQIGCYHATDGRSTHLFSTRPIPAFWLALMKRSHWWKAVARLKLRSRTVPDAEQVLATKTSTRSTNATHSSR